MSQSAVTKTELRKRVEELSRLKRYLPALQLKKKQLKMELDRASLERGELFDRREELLSGARPWLGLMAEDVNLQVLISPGNIHLETDVIAGMDLPRVREIEFTSRSYDFFEYPPWVDAALVLIKQLREVEINLEVMHLRIEILESELMRTAQRVNLFEKVKIPEAREIIRRINIHLADRRTAEFGWALLAKRKQRRREV